ncbi:hypothetical protein OA88_04530 [Flavobacterium sp. JRM]|nr:hypothetical protein OA88_04530 [Flavobacterium sp. JRM]
MLFRDSKGEERSKGLEKVQRDKGAEVFHRSSAVCLYKKIKGSKVLKKDRIISNFKTFGPLLLIAPEPSLNPCNFRRTAVRLYGKPLRLCYSEP